MSNNQNQQNERSSGNRLKKKVDFGDVSIFGSKHFSQQMPELKNNSTDLEAISLDMNPSLTGKTSSGQSSILKRNLDPKQMGSPNWYSTDLGTIPLGMSQSLSNSVSYNQNQNQSNLNPSINQMNELAYQTDQISDLSHDQYFPDLLLNIKIRDKIIKLLNQAFIFISEIEKLSKGKRKEWINKANFIIITLTELPSVLPGVLNGKNDDLKIKMQFRNQIIEILTRNKDGFIFPPQHIVPIMRDEIKQVNDRIILELLNLSNAPK